MNYHVKQDPVCTDLLIHHNGTIQEKAIPKRNQTPSRMIAQGHYGGNNFTQSEQNVDQKSTETQETPSDHFLDKPLMSPNQDE